MKILLIEPPFERFIGQRCEWYPIGLTSIATLLEKYGFKARVYNAEHDNSLPYINIKRFYTDYYKYKEGLNNTSHPIWKEVARTIKEFEPELIGISVKSVKIPSALNIAKIGKEINNCVKIVAGGFHSTICPQDLLSAKEVDFIIRDEGEETLLELLEYIRTGNSKFEEIAGISFKDKDGNLVNNPKRSLIENLDSLPYPKRELLILIGKETYTKDQLGWIITSRGCPYDCTFCNSSAIWNRAVRYRSIQNVVEEIDYLKKEYNISNFNFIDDSFTVNRKRVLEFCKILIQEKKEISWSCLTRADLIDVEMTRFMQKAGCTKIDIGIESGSENIQKVIGKGMKLDRVREMAKMFKENKMFWTGFFMMGFPTETKEDILETLRFMKEVNPDWICLSIFTPYPGTKLYEIVKEKGLMSPDKGSIYSHQNPDNCFSEKISPAEFHKLAELMIEEFDKHNRAPKSLLKRAMTRRYHRKPMLIFKDIKKMLSWISK